MAELDRAGILELLGRLGAENDAAVLYAARELHRTVRNSGATWDELLCADLGTPAADTEGERGAEPSGVTPADDRSLEPDGELSAEDKAEAARLIDRLLARKSISSMLREDLAGLKRAIADGSFDAVDSRYIRALAKRLGA